MLLWVLFLGLIFHMVTSSFFVTLGFCHLYKHFAALVKHYSIAWNTMFPSLFTWLLLASCLVSWGELNMLFSLPLFTSCSFLIGQVWWMIFLLYFPYWNLSFHLLIVLLSWFFALVFDTSLLSKTSISRSKCNSIM